MKQSILCFGVLLLVAAGYAKAAPVHGLGGVIEAEITDPAVRAAADYVTSRANTNSCNGLCASLRREGELRLIEIISAKTQVVAGTLVKLEMLMEDTKGNQMVFTCTVWSRPWLTGANGGDEAYHITKFHFQYLEE